MWLNRLNWPQRGEGASPPSKWRGRGGGGEGVINASITATCKIVQLHFRDVKLSSPERLCI